MKILRRLRLYLERNKSNTKVNLLWFFVGIASIPSILEIYNLFQKLRNEQLSVLATAESILIVLLLIACALLLNKLQAANWYLKENEVTWEDIEAQIEFDSAFKEANKKKTK